MTHQPLSTSDAKGRTLRAFADIARAMGHEHRLELLNLIAQGERPVERLAELTGLSTANASQHLQHLRRAGLVDTRRHGKRVLYQLADRSVLDLIVALQRAGEQTSSQLKVLSIEFFNLRDDQEPISQGEVVARLNDPGTLLLDVRPADEYALGHLPGAINIPYAELESRLVEIPSDRELVTYCRGPYCVVTFETVALLRAHGFRVRRLAGAFPDWKAAGHAYAVDPT